MSVCLTITIFVQSVWPIVLQGKMYLYICVQWPTATQLLPHLSKRHPHVLFCDFWTCRPVNLPVLCWYYILQEDAWLPTFLTKSIFFPLIHPTSTHYNRLMRKIMMFLSIGRFNEFYYYYYFFLWKGTPILILRIVPCTPSPPTAFINRLNCRSIFQNVS
jgi:hypothetical protein